MNYVFIFILIALSFSSFAQSNRRTVDDLVYASFTNDPREAFRAARDMIRSGENSDAEVLTQTDLEQGYCVECKNILGLTNEVTSILSRLGEAPREVEQLVAVAQYIRHVDEQGNIRCFNYQDPDFASEFRAPDLDSAVVIFSGDIDFSHIDTWRMSGGRLPDGGRPGDTIFLRGRGDDKDVFVRLDLNTNPELPPKVTLYKLTHVPANIVETANEARDRDLNLPDIGNNIQSWRPGWDRRGIYDGSLDLSSSSETSLRIGPRLEMKDYLPRNLSILDFRTRQPLTETTDLAVSGEVSARRREAKFSIMGTHEAGEKVWLKVRENGGYEVGLPYSIMYDNVPIEGGVIANQNGAGATLTYRNGRDVRTEARYFSDRGRSSYELDHRRKLTENSTITFRISRDEEGEKAWIMYRYDLD
tara:strand:- start:4471 stop:5721 length:1251 start_codon:yes stop_codon:yes gene_type:complete